MASPVLSVDNYELDTADCPRGEATKWIDSFCVLAKCLHTIAYLDAAIAEEGSNAIELATPQGGGGEPARPDRPHHDCRGRDQRVVVVLAFKVTGKVVSGTDQEVLSLDCHGLPATVYLKNAGANALAEGVKVLRGPKVAGPFADTGDSTFASLEAGATKSVALSAVDVLKVTATVGGGGNTTVDAYVTLGPGQQ
jgi:hypothetical protein